jgi:hypothetical protein
MISFLAILSALPFWADVAARWIIEGFDRIMVRLKNLDFPLSSRRLGGGIAIV